MLVPAVSGDEETVTAVEVAEALPGRWLSEDRDAVDVSRTVAEVREELVEASSSEPVTVWDDPVLIMQPHFPSLVYSPAKTGPQHPS